jgi:hypothetical protein
LIVPLAVLAAGDQRRELVNSLADRQAGGYSNNPGQELPSLDSFLGSLRKGVEIVSEEDSIVCCCLSE